MHQYLCIAHPASNAVCPVQTGSRPARFFRKSLFCLPVACSPATLVCGLRMSGLADSFATGRAPFRQAFCLSREVRLEQNR